MCTGGPLHARGKRPHDHVTKSGTESHLPPAKVSHSSRHEPLPAGKGVVKPRSKTIKLSSAKAANQVGAFFFFLYFFYLMLPSNIIPIINLHPTIE